MANKACKCESPMQNTGRPNCEQPEGYTSVLIVVPYKDDAGNINSIDATDVIDADYLSDKVNHADPSKRWYPIHDVKNFLEERADPNMTTYEDDSEYFVSEGKKSVSLLIPAASAAYLKKISGRCNEKGIFEIDNFGRIIGSDIVDGKLYPRRVDKQSWRTNLIRATAKKVQEIKLMFNIHPDESDENIASFAAEDGTDVLGIRGLIDVSSEISGESVNGFTARLVTDFGPINDRVVMEGLVAADFVSSVGGATAKVRNITTNQDVAVTVTEDPDGTYTFVFGVAQNIGDEIVLKPVKDGYDYSAVIENIIVIPS